MVIQKRHSFLNTKKNLNDKIFFLLQNVFIVQLFFNHLCIINLFWVVPIHFFKFFNAEFQILVFFIYFLNYFFNKYLKIKKKKPINVCINFTNKKKALYYQRKVRIIVYNSALHQLL